MSTLKFMEKLLDGAGVEWKTLGDVCSIGVGQAPKSNEVGDYSFVNAGTTPSGYLSEYNTEPDTITTPSRGQGGIGYVGYQFSKFWCGPLCYRIRSINEKISTRFLYYFMSNSMIEIIGLANMTGVPALNRKELIGFPIPIPPLAEQARIVAILDTFSELTAELTTELNLRKKQYHYYRDQLLRFEEGEVEWKTLGEEFPFIRNGFVGTVTPFYTDAGSGVRYLQGTNIHNGVISDNVAYHITKDFHLKCSRTELKADDILMVQSGHVGESAVVGEKYEGSNCHALIVMSNGGKCNSKFVNYYFQSTEGKKKLEKITTGGTVKHILASKMKKYLIPVPPPEEQARIVAILDKFDTLTTSITEGLPREIALRKKQYEYYRDLLLSFPKPDAEEAA